MTKKNAVCLAVSMLVLGSVFVGCNEDGGAPVSGYGATDKRGAPYTITFVTGSGGVNPETATTGEAGKLASWPLLEILGIYTFEGWFTAETGGTKVTEDYVFSENTTLYARLKTVGGPIVSPPIQSDRDRLVGIWRGAGLILVFNSDGTYIKTPDIDSPDGDIVALARSGGFGVSCQNYWVDGSRLYFQVCKPCRAPEPYEMTCAAVSMATEYQLSADRTTLFMGIIIDPSAEKLRRISCDNQDETDCCGIEQIN